MESIGKCNRAGICYNHYGNFSQQLQQIPALLHLPILSIGNSYNDNGKKLQCYNLLQTSTVCAFIAFDLFYLNLNRSMGYLCPNCHIHFKSLTSNSKKVSDFSESVVNQSDLFRVSVIPSVTKCNTRKCNTQKRETQQVTHGNKTNVIDLG